MAEFNLSDLYNTATNFLGMNNPQGTMSGLANSLVAPALVTAAKQYANAGEYERAGERAANTANPFGDRSMFRQRLDSMYTDPNYFTSDPSYVWRLNQGMGNVNRMNNAQGYQGSGKANIDLMNYAQGAASQEWAAEHNRLAELAGAKFDPANAAKYTMQGNELKLNSQNAALASLFYPALMQGTAGMIDKATNLGGTGSGMTGSFTPSQAAQLIKDGWKWISSGGDKGFFMNPSTGQVTYAPGVVGNAEQGGFIGDTTDPTQGFESTPPSPLIEPSQYEPISGYPIDNFNYSDIPQDITDQYSYY